MLNADDPESVLAMRLLARTAAAGVKPIVYWVGAGASVWLGYPSWKELTLQLRRVFFQRVAGFDNKRAEHLINREDYPGIFQMCRDLDSACYYKFIAESFLPRQQVEVHKTFTNLFNKIGAPFILTTNVDEALESSLPMCATVQRTDLGRCVDLLQERTPFVAKLHGSVSSIKSTIFATSDYAQLAADPRYLEPLKFIFTGYTVVFLAYGVRDAYVVRLLQDNAAEMDLFGSGPHFVVTNYDVPVDSLRRIGYAIKLHPDHRAALSVLDIIGQSVSPKEPATVTAPKGDPAEPIGTSLIGVVPTGKTAYYVSDLAAPGTWQTSQEITAEGNGGYKIEGAFGLGFTNDEVPFREATALHDMAVALICFDYLYLSLSALPRAFAVLGEGLLRELVRQDILRLIHSQAEVGILFHATEAMGSLGNVTVRARKGRSGAAGSPYSSHLASGAWQRKRGAGPLGRA